MIIKSSLETTTSPRRFLQDIYAESDVAVPKWLLRRKPDNNQEWDTFGQFLPALTLPVYRRLTQDAPHCLIACGRSGIPVGSAVMALAQGFNVPVPAVNRKVHTLKISTSPTDYDQLEHVRQTFQQAQKDAYPAVPSVTVMDGVTNTGETYRRAVKICNSLGGANLDWVSLTSRTTPATTRTPFIAWPGNSAAGAMVPWENRSDVLGIVYSENLVAHDLPDMTMSNRFRDAQSFGATVLATILPEIEVTNWVTPSAA